MPVVEVPAGPVHYSEHGDGPPVVLLHGLLMNQTVWDAVVELLPGGFRYIRPELPLGSHPEPMRADADLTLRGLNALIADFLAALDLRDVTLVHTDWGGGLFLTAYGLDERVSRLVILPCEAFGNFPPGLPGKTVTVAFGVPGMLRIGLRQLRIGWLRRTPLLFGWMARYPIADELVRGWTEPALRDARIGRDVRKYGHSLPDRSELIANTEALRGFPGEALVLWSSAGKVMPRDHGARLADLLPRGRLVEIDDAYVLSMLDQPQAVAKAMTEFLTAPAR
ncbi:pimeloyl-ACP methyl ester carboxylesterase [Nocardia transvalensis]|uniref:Pimeloyl-ACP methyl ester carboxylesterase n=1 Tax=Nocardia transvalensis TaxID=37333 RepID=A0A7W9UL95_9NOCA|nr:alpha/beta hydrolase [Nocardia transvalensis]MBB5917314.1 pimeloyl-ACP methyl ester carboxylesterase [Nocardia transvalensis]